MAKLIYSVIVSLDGYTEDQEGKFDWAEPDEEVHSFVNNLERTVSVYLYGRRMYETMVAWEALDAPDQLPYIQDFARISQAAEKIVFSKTLENVSAARTRIERKFNPDAVRKLKAQAESDLTVGGPNLASHAIRAGLVDEFHLFIAPIVLGSGKYFLPKNVPLDLELLDQRRFGNGMVYLRYRNTGRRG